MEGALSKLVGVMRVNIPLLNAHNKQNTLQCRNQLAQHDQEPPFFSPNTDTNEIGIIASMFRSDRNHENMTLSVVQRVVPRGVALPY